MHSETEKLKTLIRHENAPIVFAFLGSVFLSLIALWWNVAPNNDGIQYLNAADVYLEGGVEAARAYFDWLALPVAIAELSRFSGMGLEASAYLITTLCISAVCALSVMCSTRMYSGVGWFACAAVLAVPGLNEYRDYIIREFPAWFLVLLGFWLVLYWVENRRWAFALLAQCSLAASLLFRPEMIITFVAMGLWALSCPPRQRYEAVKMFIGPGVLVFSFVLVLSLSGYMPTFSRFELQASFFDLASKSTEFSLFAQEFAENFLLRYSHDDAATIILFGFFAVIIINVISKAGIFSLAAMYAMRCQVLVRNMQAFRLFGFAVLLYLIVLLVFMVEKRFIVGRYAAFAAILLVPLAAVGLRDFASSRSKCMAVVLLAVILSLANVVSTSPRKIYLLEASQWIEAKALDPATVYIESPQIAYLAGWDYYREYWPTRPMSLEGVLARREAVRGAGYDYLILRSDRGYRALEQEDEVSWTLDHEIVDQDGRSRIVVVSLNR